MNVNNINLDDSAHKILRHSVLVPNSIRCVICGPSNCGKTNAMTKWTQISEPLFVLMRVPQIKFYEFNDGKDVIAPSKASPNSVFIFDDVACENQIIFEIIFLWVNIKQIDCFNLSETSSKIPKQLLRDNANLLIIFKQDDMNLKHIYEEQISSVMSWNQFKNIYKTVWREPYTFVSINKDSSLNNGRYRFLEF